MYVDFYWGIYAHQMGQIMPILAKIGQNWPFLRNYCDKNIQKLVNRGQDVKISQGYNNFLSSKKFYTQKLTQPCEKWLKN